MFAMADQIIVLICGVGGKKLGWQVWRLFYIKQHPSGRFSYLKVCFPLLISLKEMTNILKLEILKGYMTSVVQ